jgi:hypothetical protein
MNIYDKKGIPIHVGDVVKIFHFIGPRRKRYYMYKHVVSEYTNFYGMRFFSLSHLKAPPKTETFNLRAQDQVEQDFEIVQGYEGVRSGLSYEDRERIDVKKKGGKPDGLRKTTSQGREEGTQG